MDAWSNTVAILGTGGDTEKERTYILTGPFNVLNKETLLAAQKDPQKYRNHEKNLGQYTQKAFINIPAKTNPLCKAAIKTILCAAHQIRPASQTRAKAAPIS